ncbi:virulence-associated E family protein [Paracerasibacillus soli]|uniref:Virulence-associated E family protein n=1 Tax=Paracerasibacillus soli TaxID=480284 RepID=A0ABU5CLT4_9BACI|nr:virulence-associated E family protein [Virgibacillus soli]MDY0407323.1 virulence-associated E family protein [Virgibacillus soli]
MEHDENLQGIVFNELSDNLEIVSPVPWSHPSKYWRDADDAQLVSYVDTHYGTFSARNYDIAIAKVADDRSYHPIRDYLDELPEWDKVPRVDTLLIDYLGADDNPYVRAVTRKTLCAAISRVLTPGIKFDSMLVLNGPQGVGKSTLIARLGGEWFSDSLSLSDTKDKTAAEKLQGYWIIEIGELAGLKKAEVETLRSFLSRQNDIYRASFAKRVTPHLRQCVFFGTTNAEKGYLRDTTGNRRFWPVKTPGDGVKKSWEVTEEEVLQIWAETLEYVKQGEKLYLEHDIDQLAKEEQRMAMESDEREGLVREYLETLLPDDWDDMDLFERRAFINGTEFGDSPKQGVWKREHVSNMEIWCECFQKERSNLRRIDGNEISTIMASIGGWTGLSKKKRLPIYGTQWVYELKK